MILWGEVEFSWLTPVFDFFVIFRKQTNRGIWMSHIGDDIQNGFQIAFDFFCLRFHCISLFAKSFTFANKLLFYSWVFFFGDEFG